MARPNWLQEPVLSRSGRTPDLWFSFGVCIARSGFSGNGRQKHYHGTQLGASTSPGQAFPLVKRSELNLELRPSTSLIVPTSIFLKLRRWRLIYNTFLGERESSDFAGTERWKNLSTVETRNSNLLKFVF